MVINIKILNLYMKIFISISNYKKICVYHLSEMIKRLIFQANMDIYHAKTKKIKKVW